MKLNEMFGGLVEDDDHDNHADHSRALRTTGFWGAQGAGCLFFAEDTKRFLISHRSMGVEQPGTWGSWGGAIDKGEDPVDAVKREVHEETGYTGEVHIEPMYVFTKGTFRYSNFLVIVPAEFKPRLDWENQGYKWVEFGNWPKPLHFGLVALFNDPASMKLMKQMVAGSVTEARKPKLRATVDTSNFSHELGKLMLKLGRHPYHMRFKSEWTEMLQKALKERMSKYESEDEYNIKEDTFDVADRLWNRMKLIFSTVRHNIEYECQEYQQRAAERHDRLDDLDFHIEDSNYLRGMEALDKFAISISVLPKLSDPVGVKSIIDYCATFMTDWEDNYHVTDGGEQPILDPDFVDGIEHLLPMLWFIYKN